MFAKSKLQNVTSKKANEDGIVQNELLTLLEAESDATIVYASIVLTQLNRYTAEKENRHAEIAEINKRMINIIANKVGEDNYDNYQQDQFLNYNFEGISVLAKTSVITFAGTIRRPQLDETFKSTTSSRAESRASELSYQQGYNRLDKSLAESINDEG